MKVLITVRGIDNKEAEKSQSIRNYIDESLQKMKKILANEKSPITIEVVAMVVEPNPNHEVEIRIFRPHDNFGVKRKGPELYKVIDEVVDIAFREAIQRKERFIDDRKSKGLKDKIEFRSILGDESSE
jgi:ribosome-associated translation inhibitor RaiA